MLSGDLAEKVKLEIGYKTEGARVCKNCKHYDKKRDGVAYSDLEPVCALIDEVGYFEIWEEATCNKFSRKS